MNLTDQRKLAASLLAMACLLCGPRVASGQSLLDQLEQRLRGNQPAPPPSEPLPPPAAVVEGPLGLEWEAIEGTEGLRVTGVRPESPAAAAGLQVGDIIHAAAGQPIRSELDWQRTLTTAKDAVSLQYERSGVMRRGQLEIPAGDIPSALPQTPAPRMRPSLGITVREITAGDQQRLGLPTRQGVLIGSVTPGSPAARYGLPVGGAIVAVDQVPVTSPEELIGQIRAAPLDRPIELIYYRGNERFRKQVTLAPVLEQPAQPAFPPPSANDPPLNLGADGDRPALRRLEGALDALINPNVPAANPSADVIRLEQRVQELERRILLLEERLRKIETKDAG